MKLLIIDAGHGGTDNGASAFGYREKDLVLIIAKRVQELLKEYKPDITRTKDITLSPAQRTNLIKDKYEYCLSFHLNAFNGTASGIETIHAVGSKEGKELATEVANNLHNHLDIPIRRVFERVGASGKNYYYMHRDTGTTTVVIVEGLFLDNAEDIKVLNVENIAQAIAKGFKDFMKNKGGNTPSDKLSYDRLLKQGVRGEDVRRLQIKLTELGFSTNGIDGIFGRNTRTAVKHFQSYSKITVDGLVGRDTINALNNAKKKVSKYEVFNINKQATVVKIPRKNIKEIKTIIADNPSKSQTLQVLKDSARVDLIINGGLFYWSNKSKSNHSINLLVKEGKTIVSGSYSRFSFMTDKDGSYEFDWYNWKPSRQDSIGGSPALLVNGKVNLDKGTLDNNIHNSRHPRSAIGMNEDYFFMVVIDGRDASKGLYGMTNKELANFMKSIGCTDALGLDGGGSSAIIGDVVLNKNYSRRGLHNAVGIVLA